MRENQEELKKLIIDNPTLPIKIFAGEEAGSCEWDWNKAFIDSVSIEDLVVECDYYMDLQDIKDMLYEDFEEQYESEELLENAIEDVIKNTKFEKAICVKINN